MTVHAEPTIDDAARELVFDGHTTYSFADTALPADLIEQLYDLVKHAPTAFNAQPMRLVAVNEAKDRLLPLLSEGNRAKTAQAP